MTGLSLIAAVASVLGSLVFGRHRDRNV
jgi:hypothetical protein